MNIDILYIIGVTAVKAHRDKFDEAADSLPWDEEGLYSIIPYVFGTPGARYVEIDKDFATRHHEYAVADIVARLTGFERTAALNVAKKFYETLALQATGVFSKDVAIVLRIHSQ